MYFLYSFLTKKRITPKKVMNCSKMEGNRHEIIAYYSKILMKVSVKKKLKIQLIFSSLREGKYTER